MTPVIPPAFPVERLAAILGFAALLFGGAGLIISSLKSRTQTVARRIELLRPKSSALTAVAAERLSTTADDYQFQDNAHGLAIPEQRQIARYFQRYDIAPEQALSYFTALRVVAILATAGLAYPLVSKSQWPLPLLVPIAIGICAWFLALIPVRVATKNYRNAVASGLPDAIELMAICADAGVSLEIGLQRVSSELRDSQPALAGELALTWAQISIFPDRDQALMGLAERVDLPSFRWISTTLSQSMRFGTPLAKALRTAAAEMRSARLMQLEERANRLPALLTFPVMLLIMPTIFLIVGGPAVIRILDTTQ
jgi:tight adherence protein C